MRSVSPKEIASSDFSPLRRRYLGIHDDERHGLDIDGLRQRLREVGAQAQDASVSMDLLLDELP